VTGTERFKLVLLAAVVAGLVMAGPAQAASLTVTTTADEVNADAACSLREAIVNANQDDGSGSVACAAGSGADTIGFGSLTGTVTLTGGELEASDADGLTIDGGDAITVSGNHESRVFSVAGSAQLTLRDLTVADGRVSGFGGGIASVGGTVTVTGSTVSGNEAGYGGGIASVDATVTVTDSTLAGNRALFSLCGGCRTLGGNIYNTGTVTMSDSTITGGSAAHGAGIDTSGTMTISGSTLAANTALVQGGGIMNGGTLTVTNSTLSGNTTPIDSPFRDERGGGIRNFGTATVTNSTLTGNSAFGAGGISSSGVGVTLRNTIVANNTGGDCGGAIDGGNNLIEDGSCITAATSLLGDPSLGPLANNGGPTETHALLDGSIAIGAGFNAFAAGLDFDQRGDGFARVVGGTVDIGAYEEPGYSFTGFFSPVDNSPTVNQAKAGSSIPVKFGLGGDQGLGVLAVGYPEVERYSCGDVDDADPIEQTTTANQGLTYNALTDTYTYVWKTDKNWKGKCATLTLKLDDGSEHTALFQLN
jgi:CSLREA domain-containing protein